MQLCEVRVYATWDGAGIAVTSTKSDVTITAFDIDIAGTLTAGTMGVSIHAAESSQTIGVGATAKNMHITDG
jgi:hypothetical protein